MPTTVKPREFDRAAQNKGFVVDRRGDHVVYIYETEGGKKCPHVKTKVSHGETDISASNLSKMKKQLKFSTMEQFSKYIECTFTLENYRSLLKEQGFE